MKKLFIIFLFTFLSFAVSAQVSIAPTTVFTDANGIATLYVTNPSDIPQEVNIGFIFGYPGNDAAGNLVMIYEDSEMESKFGLGERLRAFPRTFILGPNQQQTVRLQVRPDRTLPSGMYFTRVKVSSSAQTPDIGQTSNDEVTTKVNFRFEQVIAAFHKNGNVETGLHIGDLQTSLTDNKLRAVIPFQTLGNAPYLGSVYAVLKDGNAQIIAQQQQTMALYFDGLKAVELELPESFHEGTYTLELEMETKRSDIPSSDLVQASPIRKTVQIELK
ncbi:hypothetical protein [Cecembia lonarensis]|uniref:P pilus assembly protein, chaperone PapD n=1 Tax=Cecembia lonarensis (strain CCUG 58316 / KCTC 22772 / LW9) TaxID=1225176 RepID=K1LHX2_CECL9|nr:hypothetical protein [Cecembia lonarensis]EKB49858.1 hypothetical protein B879_01522 [Cecembia lonarensis LW9]